MKRAFLFGLLACAMFSAATCTVTPTHLRPVAGTRYGAEQFKDDGSR